MRHANSTMSSKTLSFINGFLAEAPHSFWKNDGSSEIHWFSCDPKPCQDTKYSVHFPMFLFASTSSTSYSLCCSVFFFFLIVQGRFLYLRRLWVFCWVVFEIASAYVILCVSLVCFGECNFVITVFLFDMESGKLPKTFIFFC